MVGWYDSSQDRWLTRDPIGYSGGVNLYGYCLQSAIGIHGATGQRPLRGSAADSRIGKPREQPEPNLGSSFVDFLLEMWHTPNNIIAGIMAINGEISGYDVESDSILVSGSWASESFGYTITAGPIIMSPSSQDPPLPHERGHRRQSDWLGPCYFPATVLSYAVGTIKSALSNSGITGTPASIHDSSPMEAWADLTSDDPDTIWRNPITRDIVGWKDMQPPGGR